MNNSNEGQIALIVNWLCLLVEFFCTEKSLQFLTPSINLSSVILFNIYSFYSTSSLALYVIIWIDELNLIICYFLCKVIVYVMTVFKCSLISRNMDALKSRDGWSLSVTGR